MRTSAWILLIAEGKVLLLQRAKSANNPLLWNFPGGNVDPGEKPIQSAIREMFEEAGIKVKRGEMQKLKPIETSQRKMVFYMVKRKQQPKVKIDFESKQYKWCSLNKFPAKLHMPTRLMHKRLLKAKKK